MREFRQMYGKVYRAYFMCSLIEVKRGKYSANFADGPSSSNEVAKLKMAVCLTVANHIKSSIFPRLSFSERNVSHSILRYVLLL